MAYRLRFCEATLEKECANNSKEKVNKDKVIVFFFWKVNIQKQHQSQLDRHVCDQEFLADPIIFWQMLVRII